MKKIISLIICSLILVTLSVPAFATSASPNAYIYLDSASHYNNIMPVKFKLVDDKSLQNGRFIFFLGRPDASDSVPLYAEAITQDSSSIVLNRNIDITSCPANCIVPIYLVVIDSDGNESSYDVYENVKTNCPFIPAIRIANPLPDTSDSAYKVYSGPNYPSITPQITITDFDSTSNFVCKYFVDNETTSRETKTVSFSNAGINTVNFSNQLNLSSLGSGYHNIKFEVTDSNNHVGTYSFWISLQ